ncbi:MAG: two component regulator propeller, partial [Prevotella sp.]
RLLPIAGTEEQNWHVTEFGNQIVVGNNHGAMKVEGMRAVLLNSNHLPSSTCMRRYTVNADEDYLIESTYSDLYVYKHVDGEWRLQNTLQGFSAPVIQFEIDKDGVIWAAHMSKGVYRIELSSDFRRIVSMHYYPSLTSKNNGSLIHVMKIRGNIVLAEGDKLYRPGTSGEFEPYHKLDHLIQDNVISSTPVDNLHFWLTTRSGYILVERRGENYHEIENVPAGFFGLECSDVSNNVKVFNGCSYFCLNGGVGRLDHRKLITASRSLRSRLKLVSAEYVTAEGIHHSLPLDSGVARAKGDVNIRLIYPNYSLRAVTFRFGLEGGGLNIHSSSALPQISFNSLNYGRYLFTAEVVDGNGQVLDRLTYRFVYARPLLLSIPALILYFILIVLGVYYVTSYFLRREKLREQRKMEEERIKQELVVERQQRIIEEQQQQLLEQQLKDKGKEIASLAMDGIMHKQKMKDIKQELQRQKKMSPQEIGKMLQALDDHKDNGDFWDIYKENFDLIHKNFFRNLRKSYPQLTTTDLKFCALFRLNLSTKEVANFTGLTVRGVEGARYRLRRKLNVPKDQSLTQFLIDFQ